MAGSLATTDGAASAAHELIDGATALVEARGKCSDLISFRLNPGLGRTDSETASNVLGGPAAKWEVDG